LARNVGDKARANGALGRDCVDCACMFFNSPDLDLDNAGPGHFAVMPNSEMITDLRRDYASVSGMIFGDIPAIDAILDTVARLERCPNGNVS
jgi:hypothetical protein